MVQLKQLSAMGRPRANVTNREFAAAFANSVTVRSTYRYDWVARIGEHSVYALLSQLAPKVYAGRFRF